MYVSFQFSITNPDNLRFRVILKNVILVDVFYELYINQIKERFPENLEEMYGIVEGLKSHNKNYTT